MRQYAINVVSLVPFSMGKNGLVRSIKMAKAAGFDGIQALPMRGWLYDNLQVLGKDIISSEGAFMFGTLRQALLRQLGFLSEPAPTFLDWVLFGRKSMPFLSEAIEVSHQFQDGVVEINPELTANIEDYLQFCRQGGHVCWDTLHVRRNKRDGTLGIRNWMKLLSRLSPDAVSLIHVHLTRGETVEFLSGGETELTNMLHLLGQKFPRVPAVLEVAPRLNTSGGTLKYLAQLLSQAKRYLDQ